MDFRKPIPGFPMYYADIYGNIWSNKFNKWKRLKAIPTPGTHYLSVGIKDEISKKPKMVKIHLLVIRTFHGERHLGMVARHLDSNILNNKPDNLRWGTRKQNENDKRKNGTYFNRGRGFARRKNQLNLFPQPQFA